MSLYNPPSILASLTVTNGAVVFPNTALYESAAGVDIRDATLAGLRDFYARSVRTDSYLKVEPGTAPASQEGMVYYDSTAHKLKVRGAAGFETITSV